MAKQHSNGNGAAREAARQLVTARGNIGAAEIAVLDAFVRVLPRTPSGQLDAGPDARDQKALDVARNVFGSSDPRITGKAPREPSADELDAREALAIAETAEAEAERHFNDLLLEWSDLTGSGVYFARGGKFTVRIGPDRGQPAKPKRARVAALEPAIEAQALIVDGCREATQRARGELTAVKLREQDARALASYTPADPKALAAQHKRDLADGRVFDMSGAKVSE